MEDNSISEDFQDLVRKGGDKVELHQQTCVLWMLEHKNCSGCSSELGCAKAVTMLGVSLTPLVYQPKDYEDFERMHQSIQSKLDKILHAKSAEEVRTLSW